MAEDECIKGSAICLELFNKSTMVKKESEIFIYII